MTDIKRLGLGCMGMNLSNKERSIETIRYEHYETEIKVLAECRV